MKRRSFQLSHEDFWKLDSVKQFQDFQNVSEAIRFCIQCTYSELCSGPPPGSSDDIITVVEKNNILLRFLLIEVVKMHQGKVNPVTKDIQDYLNDLKQTMKNQLERTRERPPSL